MHAHYTLQSSTQLWRCIKIKSNCVNLLIHCFSSSTYSYKELNTCINTIKESNAFLVNNNIPSMPQWLTIWLFRSSAQWHSNTGSTTHIHNHFTAILQFIKISWSSSKGFQGKHLRLFYGFDAISDGKSTASKHWMHTDPIRNSILRQKCTKCFHAIVSVDVDWGWMKMKNWPNCNSGSSAMTGNM